MRSYTLLTHKEKHDINLDSNVCSNECCYIQQIYLNLYIKKEIYLQRSHIRKPCTCFNNAAKYFWNSSF